MWLAKDNLPEKKFPVCLYQGVWHQLKYTNTREDKLIYLSEPFPEVHNYDVEVPKHVTYDAPTSKSETKRDPLDITICNSPALLKEPLAPETPTVTAATLDLKSCWVYCRPYSSHMIPTKMWS